MNKTDPDGQIVQGALAEFFDRFFLSHMVIADTFFGGKISIRSRGAVWGVKSIVGTNLKDRISWFCRFCGQF